MVVRKKAKSLPPDPTKPPIWFSWWVENEFRPFKQDVYQKIDEVKQYVDQKIDDLAKKNNLKQ